MGVRTVTSLKNHYRVLHVAVHKVNPEVGVIFCPPPTALDWEPYQPGRFVKGYPVGSGVWWWLVVIQMGAPTKSVLGLEVCCQWNCHQSHRALWELEPLSLPLPVQYGLSSNPLVVYGVLVTAWNLLFLADYPTFLEKFVFKHTWSLISSFSHHYFVKKQRS